MKITQSICSLFLLWGSVGMAGVTTEEMELGDWRASKRVDDFNPSNYSCRVNSIATEENWSIRFFVGEETLTSDGSMQPGTVADFLEWDVANERWLWASDATRVAYELSNPVQDVRILIDGVQTTLADPDLIQKLMGKVTVKYRYTAYDLPQQPMYTREVSLIGFTQAWNQALSFCKG